MKKNLRSKKSYLFPQPVMIIASYDEHGKSECDEMQTGVVLLEWIKSLSL